MKEYINDLKLVLTIIAIVIATIIYKWDDFFSQETLSKVKVVKSIEEKEISK